MCCCETVATPAGVVEAFAPARGKHAQQRCALGQAVRSARPEFNCFVAQYIPHPRVALGGRGYGSRSMARAVHRQHSGRMGRHHHNVGPLPVGTSEAGLTSV